MKALLLTAILAASPLARAAKQTPLCDERIGGTAP